MSSKTFKVKILHPISYGAAKYERGDVVEVSEDFMKSAGEKYYQLVAEAPKAADEPTPEEAPKEEVKNDESPKEDEEDEVKTKKSKK